MLWLSDQGLLVSLWVRVVQSHHYDRAQVRTALPSLDAVHLAIAHDTSAQSAHLLARSPEESAVFADGNYTPCAQSSVSQGGLVEPN